MLPAKSETEKNWRRNGLWGETSAVQGSSKVFGAEEKGPTVIRKGGKVKRGEERWAGDGHLLLIPYNFGNIDV